ncbi:hypothetical protein [Flavobacterium sp.]|uniref:hypothetical protein n=1 Tax=Flavobacterium sp. TaxID=239 RepID=UPI0028BF51AE|nr:hypothetical protein [Flavobacterium sp.]
MKNKFIALLAIVGLSLSYYSCQEDESLERKGKPTITFDSNDIVVKEGDNINLDFILSYPIKSDSEVRIEVLEETTAEAEVDFELGDLITMEDAGGGFFGGNGYYYAIPSLTTNHTLSLPVIADNTVEGNETLKLRFYSAGKGEAMVDQIVTITIEDSSDLIIDLNWSGTFDDGGTPTDFCDLDMDLELYDPNGDLIMVSYNDCPEQITIPTSAPDGTYLLDASLWTTNGYAQPINIPANVIFSKPGITLSETFDASSYFPMADGGLSDGNGNALITFEIIKNGHIFTINEPGGTTVFQGRVAQNMANKAVLKKKHKK